MILLHVFLYHPNIPKLLNCFLKSDDNSIYIHVKNEMGPLKLDNYKGNVFCKKI